MSERDYKVYIDDILEAIEKIERYTEKLDFSEFSKDLKTVDATIRNFEIIGEAARRIPSDIKKQHSDIPWKIMTGMRNKLVHEYFGVDKKVLWKTIKEDLSPLKPLVAQIQKGRKKLL
ncbi:DUF86 domain-containing protein [Patescibacteria group bacterium]|nr:DUF86 domain-containing protein [Patescibacteria group bacterium]MBU4162159.1 DUF86 domain-containing protein [Patescibacteria group bacterium]